MQALGVQLGAPELVIDAVAGPAYRGAEPRGDLEARDPHVGSDNRAVERVGVFLGHGKPPGLAGSKRTSAGKVHPTTDLAVAALSHKRAELAGEIEAAQQRITQWRADLAHLDAEIRILCPEAEPELIRPKKPSGRKGCDWFGRGELGRLVLDVLREAPGPLGNRELARATMERKSMVAADAVALRRVENMVDGALRRREGRMVERAMAPNRTVHGRLRTR